LDVDKSVRAVDDWYNGEHTDIIDKLKNKPIIQLQYILSLINYKEPLIQGKALTYT